MLKRAIKSYFMAIVAVVMVVGFSAFKLAETSTEEAVLKGCAVKVPDGLVQFRYDESKGFSEPAVKNLNNWIHDEHETASCSDDDEVACVIRVSPEFVNDDNPTWELDPSLILIAEEFQNNQYHITGSTNDTFMIPINKELEP